MPVGPSPFSPEYSDWYSKKRSLSNKASFKQMSAGYPTRQLKSNLTGDVYLLPRQDYNELVKYFNEHHSELSEGYMSGKKLLRKVQTPADYIDYAFESQAGHKQLTSQECAGGHIKKLTYNALYKLLMVEFTNRGDICVFFNLPANVAATLMYLAENNTMAPSDKKGRERHAVGVEFWNLVRVRGSIHNTRYPFQYTNDMRTGEAFGRRKGTGPDGKESKWVYDYTPEVDKRYKDNDDPYDPNAKLRTSPVRLSREDFQEQQKALEMDKMRTDYNDTDDELTDDDMQYYFEDSGAYERDLGKAGSDTYKVKKYHELENAYMNMTMTPSEIAKELRKLGAII